MINIAIIGLGRVFDHYLSIWEEVNNKFPDIVLLCSKYDVKNAILDGEIYPIREDGTPAPHKLMATRVHSKNHLEADER